MTSFHVLNHLSKLIQSKIRETTTSYKTVNNPYLIRSGLLETFLCNLESPFEAGGRAPGGMDIARVMGPEVRRGN